MFVSSALRTINHESFAISVDLEQQAHSLIWDIALLRGDINRNSLEINNLFQNALSTRNVRENYIRDAITDAGQVSKRIKRAFSEQKGEIKRLMAELKAEIRTFGNLTQELKENQVKAETHLEKKIDEMKEAVTTDLTTFGTELRTLTQELKENQVKAETDFARKIDEMKEAVTTDLTTFLNGVLVQDLKPSLTTSLAAMSKDVTMVTDQCVSGIQSLTQKHDDDALNINSAFQEMSLDLSKLSINVRESNANIVGELTEFAKETSDTLEYVADKVKYIKGKVNATVRLVNITRTSWSVGGRLEVYYANQWGTVCDDDFDLFDAKVACVSLGFRSAFTFKDESFYGRGVGDIWMDNVECTGVEKTLFDCERKVCDSIECSNCDHEEDVGVICIK